MEEKETGRPPYDFTEQEVLAAVANSAGIMAKVAKQLNCDWATARKYVQLYPSAVDGMEMATENVLDVAENIIVQALNNKDLDTAKWYLVRKGKARGYAERIETTGKDGGAIEVKATYKLPDGTEIEF